MFAHVERMLIKDLHIKLTKNWTWGKQWKRWIVDNVKKDWNKKKVADLKLDEDCQTRECGSHWCSLILSSGAISIKIGGKKDAILEQFGYIVHVVFFALESNL